MGFVDEINNNMIAIAFKDGPFEKKPWRVCVG